MKIFVIGFLSFGTGVYAGYYIGRKRTTKKAQEYADNQIEEVKKSLKEYYEKKNDLLKSDNISQQKPEKQDLKESSKFEEMGVDPGINDIDSRTRFSRTSETVQSDEPNRPDVMKRPNDLPPDSIPTPDGYPSPDNFNVPPYLLREADFGTLDKFDTTELILWADGNVTADDSYCEIVSPTKLFTMLPENWMNMFDWDKTGKYKSILYFRNNILRLDIQIIKDNRTYKQWLEQVYPGRADEIE